VVWSYIDLGRTFDATGQRDRAIEQYQLAINTGDNTFGALLYAKMYLLKPPSIDEVSPLPADSGTFTSPTVLSRVEPEYAAEALLARFEGTVQVAVTVEADGSIANLQVFRSLGLGLDESALAAVRRWTFAPGKVRGQAAELVTPVQVSFHLPSRTPGWHVTSVDFAQPESAIRPVLLRAPAFAPGKMSPELLEEAKIDAAVSRLPTATVTMEIDAQGNPSHLEIKSASLPIWGEDATHAIAEWRFQPAHQGGTPIAAKCTMELAWYAGE
jgi:TonB family protein